MNSAIRRRMIINYCKLMTIEKVTVKNYCWRSIEEVSDDHKLLQTYDY
jgi:hypothetical protein